MSGFWASGSFYSSADDEARCPILRLFIYGIQIGICDRRRVFLWAFEIICEHRNPKIQGGQIIGGSHCRLSVYARHILLVDRWRPMLCAFDVETSVLDINSDSPPKCILCGMWVYWVIFSTVFLYDRFTSACRLVFVALFHEDRNI